MGLMPGTVSGREDRHRFDRVDARGEISAFLTSRRARLTPEQAGLPDFGGRRRVTGLRREEVALLAGMSTQYYTRLERGNATGVSPSILEGICRALQLDTAEQSHLHDLVRNANVGSLTTRRRSARATKVRPALQQTIDAMDSVPVVVQNRRLDALAANMMGRALFSAEFTMPERPVNAARYIFLEPTSQDFFPDWAASARQTVAVLRSEAGRSPYDRRLTDLVGELSTRSTHFRTLWSSHDVREHSTGVKRIHHPIVGDLDLTFEVMNASSEASLQIVAYSAAPDSPSHDALTMLASWAAGLVAPDAASRPLPSSAHDLD